MEYRKGRDWLYNIHITPSIFDEDNVEGLCGNPNNDTTDDFIPRGSSFSTDNFTNFQKSWRYFVYALTSIVPCSVFKIFVSKQWFNNTTRIAYAENFDIAVSFFLFENYYIIAGRFFHERLIRRFQNWYSYWKTECSCNHVLFDLVESI